MKNMIRELMMKASAASLCAAALALIVGVGTPSGAKADEADAKRMVKAMSDYMAAQKAISFGIRFHPRSGHKRSSDTRFGEFGYDHAPPARQDPSDT